MKIVYNILICALIIGCNSQTETIEQVGFNTKENNQTKYIALSKKHIGFWVNEEYFNELKATLSTKKAGEKGVDDFYKISVNNSIMRMNIHEGGDDNILLLTSENKGQIFSSDTVEAYSEVVFKDGFMYAENKKYIRTTDGDHGFHELVNSAFISGKYLLDGYKVELNTDGTINGLDSIVSYKLNLDYNDAGMQFDKIYLQYNKESEPLTYLYLINSDTLIISEIDCKTLEDDYCVEVAKGKSIFALKKEK